MTVLATAATPGLGSAPTGNPTAATADGRDQGRDRRKGGSRRRRVTWAERVEHVGVIMGDPTVDGPL